MTATCIPFACSCERLWIVFLTGLSLISTTVFTTAAVNDISFLMVGNSFTNAHNLQEMIKTMLEEDLMLGRSVYAMRFRRPASRFADDIQDPALQSTISERTWTYVVLQEQSQIPAFWDTRFQYDFNLSVNATKTMNEWITRAGSETILMLTWGRRTSDWAWYPDMFPDFMSMQTKVTAGYETYQRETSTSERPVRIAPAGLAFEHIYRSVPGNASADGTDFSRLYEEDGTHPSIEGSYLVACVVYATMTGRDPRQLSQGNGPSEVSETRRQALREVAYQTVQDYNQHNEWNREFWKLHPPDSKNTPDNPSHNNEVPNPAPNKPYVPEDNNTDTASSSHGTALWMMVALVAALASVFYVRRQKRLILPRNRRAEYSDIAGLNSDFELVDVPTNNDTSI